LWAQIRADISGVPATVPPHLDTSPIGAAMLAAVAVKIQPDLETCSMLLEAAEAAVAGKTIFKPDPARVELYNAAYAAYGRLFGSLKPMFEA
jgi:sugar (pentulose or hexulose) kinase